MAKKKEESKILCLWCNAPWTPRMDADLETTEGCDTCGHGARTYGTIRIYCDGCGKLVYVKEVDQ